MRPTDVTEITQRREPTACVIAPAPTSDTAPAPHAYVIPVVRELPPRAALAAGSDW